LICMTAEPTNCVVPFAPVSRTEDQCLEVLYDAIVRLQLADSMFVSQVACYGWPVPA